MIVSELLKFEQTNQNIDDFKALAEKLCRMLESEGVLCKPYREGLPYFTKLTEYQQKEAIRNLGFYVDLCREQMLDGYKLSDNLSFTWRAFRKLNLIPRSDLFQMVSDEDVLEIYSSDSRQLYRNLRFYEHCSYSLEELYSLEWWSLFHRDEHITASLMESAAMVLNGECEGHVYPTVGTHVVRELCSEEKLANIYEPRLLSPLFCNKKVEGIFAAVRLVSVEN
ncbi:hypothetical protein D3C87_123240 [compost metagenome]